MNEFLAFVEEFWHPGSYESSEESLIDHFKRHGKEVDAEDAGQYLRKALGLNKI
jgi:hypothetical protein